MAKKTKKAEEPDGAQPAGGGRGRKVPLIAAGLVAVGLLGAGAMAGGLVGGGTAAAEGAGQGTEEAEAAASEAPDHLGPLVELEAVTVNLADGRFLKVGAALELDADAMGEEGSGEAPADGESPIPTAPVYDVLIAEFNRRTVPELTDPAVREEVKARLLEQLAQMYGEQIADIWFTEFVMQ
jgi:flagellar protein FliL